LGIISFAQKFADQSPDLLLVLGDRIEMLCGPVAAMSYNIPVAHIHGGAVTEGAIDELVRHAITKMSHIHFVSCRKYADRLIQMGEEAWRVFNAGAPGLDRILTRKKLSKAEISARIGLDIEKDTLLVTYHPVTLEIQDVGVQVEALLAALESTEYQVVMTYPNVDVGNAVIIDRFYQFSEKHKNRVRLLKNAGTELYFALLDTVSAMVGNSSSGISEAPSFQLPVVNIGTRQTGKLRAPNVIDVGYSVEEIISGIQKAASNRFKKGLKNIKNPYGDGHAAKKILEVLRTIEINDRLIRKKFVDLKQ
jgi:GDP/UDP-N,N'-diacetylbacillosamine 2-epimerase (hydrolysing)